MIAVLRAARALHLGWRSALTMLVAVIWQPLPAGAEALADTSEQRASASRDLPLAGIPVGAEGAEPPPDRDEPTWLEPIEVTAGKRVENLRQFTGSVDVLTGERISQLHASSAEDYLKLVPGIALNKEGVDRGDFPIRGVATETRFQSTQRATGIYVDDIPMSDPFIPISQPDLNPFDLERIEVLKGPQATLFGSSGLAGAVRYITRKPVFGELQGVLSGSNLRAAEGNGGTHAAGMLNLPVGDSVALRGIAIRRDDPGYIDDARAGVADVARTRQRQDRIHGSWNATDRLAVAGSYLQQTSRQDDLPYGDQRERLEHRNALAPSPTRSAFDVGNLVVSYQLPWADLMSSTSRLGKAADVKLEFSRGLGMPDVSGPLFAMAAAQADGLTQEIRLSSVADGSKWRWLAGAWVMRYKSRYKQLIPTPGWSTTPIGNPLGDTAEIVASQYDSRGVEKALFGDVSRTLGDWEFGLGGRIYRTDVRAENVNRGLLVMASSGALEQRNEDRLVEEGFNPRLTTSFRVSDRSIIYGLVSRGFRFGGVQLVPPNPAGSAGTGIDRTFKSDTLWNHELGWRSDWLAGRLITDAVLFYGKWKDLQITRPDNTGFVNFVQNIASAHTQGLEVSVQAAPFAGFTIASAAAFIEARTDEPFVTSHGEVPPDTRLPGTPKFQIANSLSYEIQVGPWVPGASLIHSHIGTSPNNLFATELLGGYDTLDVHAHLRLPAMMLQPRIALSLTNAGDVRGIAGAFADPVSPARDFYFVTPRTVSLTTTLTF